MILKNPKTLATWNSARISASASAKTVKDTIWRYYWNTYRTHITVNLYTYDKDGNITSNATEIVKREYQIICNKLLPQESVASIMIVKATTKSKIVALAPSKVQVSSPPLTGKYKFKCTSKTGAISFSDEINYNEASLWAQQKVFTGCS